MIIKATIPDIPALNILINSAYRGETSKKGRPLKNIYSVESELTKKILPNFFSKKM